VGECGGGGCVKNGGRRGVAVCGEDKDEVSDLDQGVRRASLAFLAGPVSKTSNIHLLFSALLPSCTVALVSGSCHSNRTNTL
jgi:hypothetical protein